MLMDLASVHSVVFYHHCHHCLLCMVKALVKAKCLKCYELRLKHKLFVSPDLALPLISQHYGLANVISIFNTFSAFPHNTVFNLGPLLLMKSSMMPKAILT